jgi:hypothetical protein
VPLGELEQLDQALVRGVRQDRDAEAEGHGDKITVVTRRAARAQPSSSRCAASDTAAAREETPSFA